MSRVPAGVDLWPDKVGLKWVRFYDVLVHEAGATVSHDALVQHLDDASHASERHKENLRQTAKKLRDELEACGRDDLAELVRTVQKVGYRFGSEAEFFDRPETGPEGPDPYRLLDADHETPIRLCDVIDLLTREPHFDGGHPTLDLWFVLGSGRYRTQSGHSARACDAVNLPEIAVIIGDAFRRRHANAEKEPRVRVRTNFDLVLWPESLAARPQGTEFKEDRTFARPHVITVGMGDVNRFTEWLVQSWEEVGHTLRPGPAAPNSERIVPVVEHETGMFTLAEPGHGWLCATRNPKLPDRLVIACAGVDGLGTQAASWALLQYCRGTPLRSGEPAHPANHIVRGAPYNLHELGDAIWHKGKDHMWTGPLHLGRAVEVIE